MNKKIAVTILLLFLLNIYSKAPEGYTIAFKQYKSGNYDQSVELFNKFIVDNPKHFYLGNAYFWLGIMAKERDQLEQAENFFLEVTKSSNKWKHTDAMLQLNSIYESQKDYGKSKDILNRIIGQIKVDRNLVTKKVEKKVKEKLKKLDTFKTSTPKIVAKETPKPVAKRKEPTKKPEKKKMADSKQLNSKLNDLKVELSNIDKKLAKHDSDLRYNKLLVDNYNKRSIELKSELSHISNKDNKVSNDIFVEEKKEEKPKVTIVEQSKKEVIESKPKDIYSEKESVFYQKYQSLKTKYPDFKGYMKIKILFSSNNSVKTMKVVKSSWIGNKKLGNSFEKYIKKNIYKWKFEDGVLGKEREIVREYRFK